MFLILVLVECNKLGITVDKKSVRVHIQNVMDFFFLGKAHRGKVFTKKSKSKVVAGKSVLEKNDALEIIEQYCDQRLEDGPIIISCDEYFAKQFCGSIGEPYYVLSSNDMNLCSFSKELGNIMLQDKCNILMETSNLSKSGKERLVNIVDKLKSLFDNRVRLILSGEKCMEELSERRFEKPSGFSKMLIEQTPTSRKRPKSSDCLVSNQDRLFSEDSPKQIINLELLKTKESLTKAMKDKTESECKIKELMEENESLKMNIRDSQLKYRAREKALEREKFTLTEELKHVEGTKAEAITATIEFDERVMSLIEEKKSLCNKIAVMKKEHQSKVENLENENKSWSEKVQVMEDEINNLEERSRNSFQDIYVYRDRTDTVTKLGNDGNIDVGCQTKKVDISLSNISLLLKKIKEDRSHSTCAKVHACIKNFDCSTQNMPDGSGGFCCKVEITNGKTILMYPDILSFEGRGATMSDAKEVAFETFISLMKTEAEK